MDNEKSAADSGPRRFLTLNEAKAHTPFQEGEWVETAGFHTPGDGGGALYRIRTLAGDKPGDTHPNDADIIALEDGLVAVLHEREAVNYRMFGAVGDGEMDDGVRIKQAHEYANQKRIPIVNLSGEFWIKQTNDIPITTNVQWGQTTFHIDERHNVKDTPRFVVRNDRPD